MDSNFNARMFGHITHVKLVIVFGNSAIRPALKTLTHHATPLFHLARNGEKKGNRES